MRGDNVRLPVYCWCERIILWVPKAMVAAGRTGSCGTPMCEAMDKEAAA